MLLSVALAFLWALEICNIGLKWIVRMLFLCSILVSYF